MFTLPDISIVANVAQAIAVIVAVLFGIVQLRQLAAQRRREAAFALMHSLQSPQMSCAILILDRLPDDAGKTEIDALPESDQIALQGLLATWESLGILVFNSEICSRRWTTFTARR